MRLTLPVLLAVLLLPALAHAEEAPKPDDHVAFELGAEEWVTTKTARVTVNVEAAISGAMASSARADMVKSVNAVAAGDWRLTSFNRNQDQTGLEHWSASFEARLPETGLGGLNDNAKKQSKAGMQLSIAAIDFSPTLDEVENTRANLRTQLYKKTAEQLAALNSSLPGRTYRIAAIEFDDAGVNLTPVNNMRMMKASAPMALSAASMAESAPMERSEKLRLTARVVLATASAAAH